MRRLVLVSAVALALTACDGQSPSNPSASGDAAATAPAQPPELIPRDTLFGNPERANV